MAPNPSDQFSGLWIDAVDGVEEKIKMLPSHLVEYVEFFVKHGYVIIKNVVPEDVIDEIIADTENVYRTPEDYVVRCAGKYKDPTTIERLGFGDRIIDLYAISPAARAAIHSPLVSEFLQTIFEQPAIAMQSLSFTYGSQQSIHQDTAYVISKRPLHLAASWLALEDVVPGSGELIYYPGSHKFDHFLFNGVSKGWQKKHHGDAQHISFLKQLHEQAKERGISLERFIAKKGDMLIWHADLAHGGDRSTVPEQTRKSLVTHYCPLSVKPKYFDLPSINYFELPVEHSNASRGFFTSRHFDMENLNDEGRAPISYDAGITKRRQTT